MKQYAFITITCTIKYEIFYYCRRFTFLVGQLYKYRQSITCEFTLTVAALNKLTVAQHCSISSLLWKVLPWTRGAPDTALQFSSYSHCRTYVRPILFRNGRVYQPAARVPATVPQYAALTNNRNTKTNFFFLITANESPL